MINLRLHDYQTGEYVDSYKSVEKLSKDFDIPVRSIYKAISGQQDCYFIRIPRHKILLIEEEKYQRLKELTNG